MEKVTIIGGGNGAFAAASDLTIRGHQGTLYELPQFAENLKEVIERGGIELEAFENNGLTGGFAKLYKITTDISEALAESEIVMIIVPSYSLDTIAELCAPHLRENQIVALCPANPGGSLVFRHTMDKMGYNTKIWLAEFACMMYACRKKSASSIWIRGYKHNLGVAFFPNQGSEPAFQRLQALYPFTVRYGNVIETGFSNLNTTLHTSLMLLNTANIDNKEDRLFYRECTTAPSLDNILSWLDRERLGLNTVQGMNLLSVLEIQKTWYAHQGASGETSTEILHSLKHFAYSKMPTTMDYRYVTEDVPFGLIPCAQILELFGLEHKTHTALANVLCAVCNRDFYQEARTLEKMGIDGMSKERLLEYLNLGY